MKKTSSSSSSHSLNYFPSPGAPNYRNKTIVTQKGWSSERIPKHGSSNNNIRRHTMSGLTMTPFSGGRTLPSKWDEAERWICSPVSTNNDINNNNKSRISHSHSQLVQRRPKSISGPIVHHPVAYYYSNNYSPTIPLGQGLVVRNLMVGSPFSTGVLAPVAVSVHHYDDDNVFGYDNFNNGIQYSSSSDPLLNENSEEQIFSAPMCSSEQPCDPSSPVFQDENHDGRKIEDTKMFSGCDKGTQMSPSETDNDVNSSPECSVISVMDQQDCRSSKLEVRDVQVDSQATVIRGSKRHAAKLTKTDSLRRKDLRENSTEAQSSSWDIEVSNSDISKLHREEAKIVAWENLQKAKAEAAIRKLEMKLEKKRSSSMDKILNKLRKAQMKAENMRSLIPEQQNHRISNTCKLFSIFQIWSPICCFSSHAQ